MGGSYLPDAPSEDKAQVRSQNTLKIRQIEDIYQPIYWVCRKYQSTMRGEKSFFRHLITPESNCLNINQLLLNLENKMLAVDEGDKYVGANPGRVPDRVLRRAVSG